MKATKIFFDVKMYSACNYRCIFCERMPYYTLRAYEDLKAFKLFMVDVGLLGCMAGLRQRTLLDGNDLFMEFKGAFNPQISVRTSMADYKKEDWLLNLPLYAVEEFGCGEEK